MNHEPPHQPPSTIRRSIGSTVALLVLGAMALGMGIGIYFVTTGVSARARPGSFETAAAHTIRNASIAMRTRGMTNPVAATPDVVNEGMEHFADHCAVCHGNDGGGSTEMNRGLCPQAPDMRLAATQNLSDAELFYIIENGVRLTGMPGWGNGTKEGETSSWHLVHFIRHLPKLTDEEVETMEGLNPKSPEQIRQEIEAEKFLNGGDAPAPSSTESHAHGDHHE
jgi:mono/diheme cytochrome c family protein